MEERRLELKVGALLFIAVLGAVGLLYLLGEISLGAGSRIHVDFAHSGGVPKGAPVKLSGVRVGRVKELTLLPGRRDSNGEPLPVRIQVEIETEIFRDLHRDTTFVVATQGPLGEPFLELSPGTANAEPLREGAELRGIDPPRMDLLSARLYGFLDAATQALGRDPKIIHDLFRSAAGLASKAEEVLEESRPAMARTLSDLSEAATELKGLSGKASALFGRKSGEAEHILEDLSAVSAQLRKDLPPIAERAQRAVDGAASVAGAFTPADVQRLRDAIARYEKAGETLSEVAARADRVLAKVEAGEGTLGLMMKDPKVYEELKAFVTDLKRHPWKILWKE